MASGKDIQKALASSRKHGIDSIKSRKKGKGVLARLSGTPKKGRAGATIKGYFV